MLKDAVGMLIVLILFFVPSALFVTGIAVGCERLLRRWIIQLLWAGAARFSVYWAVIALFRLFCLWVTRPPAESASYFFIGGVYTPEMMLIDLPRSPTLEITLRAVLIIGDSALWAFLLCKLWNLKKPSGTTVA